MLLMGIGLLGGAVGTVLVQSFKAIDEQGLPVSDGTALFIIRQP